MRLELAGTLARLEPLILKFDISKDFDCSYYRELGYTHFDVICIGGVGGMGGGIDTANTGTLVRNYGGAGGGGGFHRVRGLLSALPTTCPVVVGAGGSLGTEHASLPAFTTDGGDGGYSSFNNPTCRASGGKGGKRAQSNSLTVATLADGGEGGVGDRTTAGGGAAGGVAGTPTSGGPGTPGTDGSDGTFANEIGQGGGGGAGGVGKYGSGGTTCNAATKGGRGSYNSGNMQVYAPGSEPNDDAASSSADVVPGGAGGAKASPLNGLPNVYGSSKNERVVSDPGIVILRLSVE